MSTFNFQKAMTQVLKAVLSQKVCHKMIQFFFMILDVTPATNFEHLKITEGLYSNPILHSTEMCAK